MKDQLPFGWFQNKYIWTGSSAKVKVLSELAGLISTRKEVKVLDVGCVGPKPFDLWEPLLEAYQFSLTGVDLAGIERAQEIARSRGWQTRLEKGSGYDLTTLFSPESFDVVVATQVLEHIAKLQLFMDQVSTVLRSGGIGYFTLDSAHWRSRFSPKAPVRLAKNVVKKALSWIGNEQNYDLPWFDYEVVNCCDRSGLRVTDVRYYNINPLKFLHNHIIDLEYKNRLMQKWFELEELLNEDEKVKRHCKGLFMGLYIRVEKPTTS